MGNGEGFVAFAFLAYAVGPDVERHVRPVVVTLCQLLPAVGAVFCPGAVLE